MARGVHYGAIGCAVVGLGLSIGALAVHWYAIIISGYGIEYEERLYWNKVVMTGSGGEDSSESYGDHNQNVKKNMDACLAFLVLGFAATLVFLALFSLQSFRGTGDVNRLPFGIVLAATVLTFISFFAFMGMPSSFKKDGCGNGSDSSDSGASPCTSLFGSVSELGATMTWGPGPGWFLALVAAIFLAVASGVSYKARG